MKIILFLLATIFSSVSLTSLADTMNTQELIKMGNPISGLNHAEEVMRKVIDRYIGHTKVSTMSLMTCAYEIRGNKLGCSSDVRRKQVKSLTKNYGKTLQDSKGVLLITLPISEYGISILQYDYISNGKDADQWLYLPELDQIKRIASSSDAPKKGSLFGSEFALEDLEREILDEYSYKVLEVAEIDGRPVTVVEQRPVGDRANKTNYQRRVKWIDSERFIVLKEEFYELNGKLLKVNRLFEVRKLDKVWTAFKQTMRNVRDNRISMMSYDEVKYNLTIDDEYLTQRVLSDAIFRDKLMNSLK